jgi:hypothetical protein
MTLAKTGIRILWLQNLIIIKTFLLFKIFFKWGKKNAILLATLITAFSGIAAIFYSVLEPAEIFIQSGSFIAITPKLEKNSSGDILKIPVSIYNDGAKPGIIQRIGLVIKDPSVSHAYFFKSNFDEILKQDGNKKIWQLNSAYSAIIIPPRTAISRNFQFVTSSFKFSSGKEYTFWILGWDKQSQVPSYRGEFKFSFDKEDVDFIERVRETQNKILKSDEKIEAGDTITPPENGKYGPITGAIDNKLYNLLTGGNSAN